MHLLLVARAAQVPPDSLIGLRFNESVDVAFARLT
jgi:hypothetical protein